MAYDVKVEQVEPLTIATVRRRASIPELSRVIPEGCGEVWNFIRANAIPHTGKNLALYWDMEMNLDCGVIVNGPFEGNGSVTCSTTPGGLVATVVHVGPYHRLGEAHDAIVNWSRTSGRRLARPCWEVYDHWTDDPAQLRTDVFYVLEDQSNAGAPSES